MKRTVLGKAAILAAMVLSSALLGQAVQAQDDPNAETKKETERLKTEAERYKAEAALANERAAAQKARIDALGLPKFEGKQTVNAGSVAIESWLLSSTAVDAAATKIHAAVRSELSGKEVLLLSGSETMDFGQVAMLKTEIAAISQRLAAACRCDNQGTEKQFTGVPAIVPLIGAAAGLLRSDTELTALDATIDSRLLVAAVAGKMNGKGIVPSAAVATDLEGGLAGEFQKMVALAELAANRRDELAAKAAPAADEKIELARLNAALGRYDSFFTKVTSANDKGVVPLAVAARLDKMLAGNPLILRVTAEKSGGTLMKRTNLVTMLGGEAVSISGGLVASYELTDPKTGAVEEAGLVTCRTALTSLKRVQEQSWRTRSGSLRSKSGGQGAICDLKGTATPPA